MSFSTRFLPTDGIPEYNALLDRHLGHHRNYLLGSKSSLKLLQKTGAIAGVEQGQSDDQYIVYLDSPKPKPAAAKQTNHTNEKTAKKAHPKSAPRRKPQPATQQHQQPTLNKSPSDNNLVTRKRVDKIKPLVAPPALPPEVDDINPPKMLRKSSSESKPSWSSHRKIPPTGIERTPQKPVVNHLLESDVAYHEKIERYKAIIEQLDIEKAQVQSEIANSRKLLRGVNAVHDNDVAVAHCHSVVQHRLGKAQEEYMKVLTQQAFIRKTIDEIRQEIVSLAQVRHKLEVDIDDAKKKITKAEKRINETKLSQKDTFAELSNLERQAEADSVERIMKLPPEDDMVSMDVANLMQTIHDRAKSRKELEAKAKLELEEKSKPVRREVCIFEPTYRNAFQVIQKAVDAQNIDSFVSQFIETEDQLISMYKHQTELQAETKKAKAELEALQTQTKHMRMLVGRQEDEKLNRKAAIEEKIANTQKKTNEYKHLQRKLAAEMQALRGPIMHLLEVLKADKHFMHTNGYLDPLQELPLHKILGIAQERIIEFAILTQVQAKQKQSQANPSPNKDTVQSEKEKARRQRSLSTESSTTSASPNFAGTIIVGPRVPPAHTPHSTASTTSPPSFETMMNATTLPGPLSAEGSLDSTIPLSSYQLFQRALQKNCSDND